MELMDLWAQVDSLEILVHLAPQDLLGPKGAWENLACRG